MKKILFLPYFFLGLLLIGCSSESAKNKIPALFDTKLEAEKAAKKFNCIGAHKMGNKWMPCEKHSDSDHHHHHNH